MKTSPNTKTSAVTVVPHALTPPATTEVKQAPAEEKTLPMVGSVSVDFSVSGQADALSFAVSGSLHRAAQTLSQRKYEANVEKLAYYWQTTVQDAKSKIEYKIQNGFSKQMDDILAKGAHEIEHDVSRRENLSAYFGNTQYTYADAEAIAKHWNTSVTEAKVSIGYKIRYGFEAQIDQALEEIAKQREATANRKSNSSSLQTSKYTYADAAKLAHIWNTTIEEAISYIDFKVQIGGEEALDGFLASETNNVC